jgi:hypothetical protein
VLPRRCSEFSARYRPCQRFSRDDDTRGWSGVANVIRDERRLGIMNDEDPLNRNFTDSLVLGVVKPQLRDPLLENGIMMEQRKYSTSGTLVGDQTMTNEERAGKSSNSHR